jgi:hypothetical protein
MNFGSRYHDSIIGARENELIGDRQAVEEAGTLGADIEGAGGVAADLVLEEATSSRKRDVGSHRCKDDEVDIGDRDACIRQLRFQRSRC